MTLHPHNQMLICVTDIPRSETVVTNGIVFNQENIQEFEVISVSDDLKAQYQPGDKIMTDVFPTQLECDRKTFYLVQAEHIAGKVEA